MNNDILLYSEMHEMFVATAVPLADSAWHDSVTRVCLQVRLFDHTIDYIYTYSVYIIYAAS